MAWEVAKWQKRQAVRTKSSLFVTCHTILEAKETGNAQHTAALLLRMPLPKGRVKSHESLRNLQKFPVRMIRFRMALSGGIAVQRD